MIMTEGRIPQAAKTISWTIIIVPLFGWPWNRVYNPCFQITQIPHGWLTLVCFIKYTMIYRLMGFCFFQVRSESFLFSGGLGVEPCLRPVARRWKICHLNLAR